MTRGSTSFERKDGEAFQNFVGFGTVISELPQMRFKGWKTTDEAIEEI
jgi:hypothetical protein